MNIYTVLLADGTKGQITSANAPKLGYEMTVAALDESGKPTKATGVVTEILEEKMGSRKRGPA